MPRLDGPYWSGYSAFQLRCERQQWTILADKKDTRPFLINDACDPKLPDWLITTRWGENGYSTWCKNIGTALREAGNSKSRGWKRINGMDYNQLSEAWWVVFELILHAEQVCDLMNRFKITCNIKRKGVPSWRISEDIFLPNIQANGGLVHKHIVHGWGMTVFHFYDNFTPGLCIFKGDLSVHANAHNAGTTVLHYLCLRWRLKMHPCLCWRAKMHLHLKKNLLLQQVAATGSKNNEDQCPGAPIL